MTPILITTLGTAHGSHTWERFNTSTLYNIDGAHYLIDCGEPVAALMRRGGHGFDRLRATFVTHMDSDHIAGIALLIKMFKHARTKGLEYSFYLPEGIDGILTYLETVYLFFEVLPYKVDFHEVTEGDLYADDRLRVIAHPTCHMLHYAERVKAGNHPNQMRSFAYVLHAQGKRIVHTGDMKPDFPRLGDLLKEPCDLLVSEMTHVRPENLLPFLADKPVGRLLLTHIHDPWHGTGEETLMEMAEQHLPFEVIVAHDGTTIAV